MSLVMGGSVMLASSANTCDIKVPAFIHPKNKSFSTFSCQLSESCCHGLQDVVHMATVVKGGGKPQGGKGRAIRDLVATCDRIDQVELYNCAVETVLQIDPTKGAMIQAKGCNQGDSPYPTFGADGDGHCTLLAHKDGDGKGTFEIDGVSAGCCKAVQNLITGIDQVDHHVMGGDQVWHRAQCGMIGHCGKQDQRSIYNFTKTTFDMTLLAQVVPGYKVEPHEGSGAGHLIEQHVDVTVKDCAKLCNALPKCRAFTYFHARHRSYRDDGRRRGYTSRRRSYFSQGPRRRSLFSPRRRVALSRRRSMFSPRRRVSSSAGSRRRFRAMELPENASTAEDSVGTCKLKSALGNQHKGGPPDTYIKDDAEEESITFIKSDGSAMPGSTFLAVDELLEMFDMTNVAPREIMATFLTSEDEVIEDEADVTEDDATEDDAPIVTGILGFLAGATFTVLGLTVLRRSSPSPKDQYSEIVA